MELYLGCVYFDRSKGGPNRGAWATQVRREGRVLLVQWQREEQITSNQAILRAILLPLRELNSKGFGEEEVQIHTIYQYLYRGFTQWSGYWLENEFRSKVSGMPIRNRELWQEVLDQRHRLQFIYHPKGTHPIINKLIDFCWEKFDTNPVEVEADSGVPVWHPPVDHPLG